MPISIPVAATADDRSFQQVANRYTKWGKDTGKSIGQALADGVNDKDLDKAFSKVVDGMSKIRAEEARLTDMRRRNASDGQIVAQEEKLIRLRNSLRLATNDTVRSYEALHTKTTGLTSATNMLSTALSNTRFASLSGDVERLGAQFGTLGLKMAAGAAAFAAVVVAAVEVTKALYGVGERWDAIADSITIKTGKMGDDLTKLTDIVKDVGTSTAASFESIGSIVTQISQSMPDLADNAEAVRQVTASLAFLDANGQSVEVRNLGRAMQAFGIDASKASDSLDELYTASAQTGIPINELIGNLVNLGPAAETLGLSFDDATGLLVSFEKAGIDANNSTMMLNTAAKVFADSNINLKTGLRDTITQIKGYIESGNEAAAVDLAGKVFGERGAEKFVQLIRSGKIGVDDLTAGLGNTQGAIDKAKSTTEDWSEQWTILKNRVSELAENVGGPVFDAFNKVLGVINEIIAKPIEMPHGPSGPLPQGYNPGTLGSMMMPGYVPPVPGAPGGAGAGATPAQGGQSLTDLYPILGPLAPAPPPGGWPAAPPPQDINQAIEDAKKNDDKKPKEPKPSFSASQYSLGAIPLGAFPGEQGLPGLPGRRIEQHTGPGAYEVDPQRVFDAQTAIMSSNKQVEDARTRVLEIQADNNHTEQQLQSAKDALAIAARNNLKTQQDLIDAQQGTWKAAEKSTKDFAKNMEDFGVALDKDFGLSKGLPGLAENLAKFIGGIVAAPLLGPLGAIAGAQGGISKTGSGLIAMAAASGVLGPQFQDFSGVGMPGLSQSSSSQSVSPSSSSVPSSAGRGGWMGDAALLARVPKGVGRYDNVTKDLSKGLVDCASGVEDLVNIIDGQPTAGGSLWTGNASTVLPKMGFLPGIGGPGDFRIGYRNGGPNNGHMQATLPDGTNVNFGSTSAIQAGGLDGGMGAYDPSFTDFYHRPMGGGAGASLPAPGSGTSAGSLPGGGSFPIPLPVTIVGGALDNGGARPASGPGATPAPGGGSTPGSSPYNPLTPAQLTDPGLTNPTPSGGNIWGVPVLHRDSGGGIGSGASLVINNTGKPETVVNPQGMVGNQHVSELFPGPGPGNSGGIGSAAVGPGGPGTSAGQQGPTEIGGAEPDAQNGSSQGGGGGLFGAAVGAGAAAADMWAPGSGQAVQIAGQEIQRAIKAGGQFAGIVAGGLMETFLPTGGSEIANDNWITRIAGGFSGMAPQLPNTAGKAPTPVPQNQMPGSPPAMPMPGAAPASPAAPASGPTFNLTLNSNGPVDDKTVDTLTGALNRQYETGMGQMGGR